MWMQNLCACLCESYRDLDATLASAGDAGDAQRGPAAAARPGALIARMNGIADAFPPPPGRGRDLDLIVGELCRTSGQAGTITVRRQLLDRCRLSLCQAYLMLCGGTRKEILASVRSAVGDGFAADGAISITCILSGVDRRCLTGDREPGRPWRVVSRHMSAVCGLSWAVEALEEAAAACGMPRGDMGGVVSSQDVVEALQSNWPRSMPSLVDAGEPEDVVVLAVHRMIVGIARDLARGNALRLSRGTGAPGQARVASLSIQERVVTAVPEGDNSFSPWRGAATSLPLCDGRSIGVADMHNFSNWHAREYLPTGGRDVVFTRRIKCTVTCDVLESMLDSAMRSMVSPPERDDWNPWGWGTIAVEVGCSVSNARGTYGAKHLTTNSICTRHVEAERETGRRRAAELDTQARWKLAYLRMLHRVFTVEAVVEDIVEAYIEACIRESRVRMDSFQ